MLPMLLFNRKYKIELSKKIEEENNFSLLDIGLFKLSLYKNLFNK